MDRLDIVMARDAGIAVARFYDLTDNKERQLTEREEVIQGSNQAILEMHESDIQEIRTELQKNS